MKLTPLPGKTPADRWAVAGVVLLALYVLAGVIYAVHLRDLVRFQDEQDYLDLTHNMVKGIGFSMDGVQLTAYRPPGFAFFLAALESMGGGTVFFRVVQFLLLGVTIALVPMLFPREKMFAGLLIVTALVIVYPVLFYLSGTLYSQPLSSLLFVLGLVLLLGERRGLGLNAITGLVFGALILTVPTFLITMVLTLALTWWFGVLRWRAALVVFICACLPLLAWGTRNAVYLHHFVPVSSNSGLNFAVGNHAGASPSNGADTPDMWPIYRPVEQAHMDEFQANSYYWNVSLTWIKEHPGDAVTLYFEKVLNFFALTNDYAEKRASAISGLMRDLQGASYAFLLALLAWRLWEAGKFPLNSHEKLFLLLYVLTAFTSAIFLTRIRLRLPYDFLIIAVIALHLSRHVESWVSRKGLPTKTS